MIKTKDIKIIDDSDFDKLVQETYGKPYCFQQQDDCKERGIEYITVPVDNPYDYENDTVPEIVNGEEMGVSFKAWLERDPNAPLNPSDEELESCNYYWPESEQDKEKYKIEWCERTHRINLFYERNFYPSVDMIVNDLHAKGLLPAGEYGINIDW